MIRTRRILQAAREALRVDVVILDQFAGDERVFRAVEASCRDGQAQDGGHDRSGRTRHALMAEGALPSPMLDATRDLRAEAVLGAPVRLSDGTLFGTLRCISHVPRPDLAACDPRALHPFAAMLAEAVEQDLRVEQLKAGRDERIRRLLASGGPSIVYQPVFMLDDMRLAGAEALSRFPPAFGRSPDLWFQDAAEAGMQVELELLAIRNALTGFSPVWTRRRVQLGLNASAATILDERLWRALEDYPRELIVIELTEHEGVDNYPALLAAVSRLRERGTKLAIDDVGAGYASMRHVLTLRPDILKLDAGLVRSVDADDLKLALVSSLKHFADQFACRVVAEGIETAAELAMVRQLGLQAAQGFLLGTPAPIEALPDDPAPSIGAQRLEQGARAPGNAGL